MPTPNMKQVLSKESYKDDYDEKWLAEQEKQAGRRLALAKLEAEQNPQPSDSVYFTRETDESGRSRLIGHAPASEIDEARFKEAKLRADALNEQFKRETPKKLTFEDVRHLTPTKRLEAVEEIALPVLNQLQEQFKAACDACTELESPVAQMAKFSAAYIAGHKHSKIKIVYCNGVNHRNALNKSGELPPKGFKVWHEQPLSNLPGSSKIICISEELNDIADLLNDEETKEHAAKEVKFLDEKAEHNRKKAAVALAEYKKIVQAELDDIQPLTKLLKSFGVNN
ncbi:TPA: hypothetical protein JG872_000344 [Enterobacter hormaechei subsp. xiangfangensis]|nr:hypothetical protein [Enterobacter hormaechei subsp. xiangfangensis]HAV1860650.1 hypothetical protein [Enterobacter hormaechei subsp. xiangfangensis]